MKINILFGEKFCEKSEIEIDKYKTVKHFKSLICDLLKEKIGNNFDFIYGNIILNDEKLITFYNMKENDEIKIGKLEQFLNCDDVIVELFVAGWNATFIHLIVNKYDNCSLIKSIIFTMIPEYVNMWNRNGIEMRNEQVVNEIDLIGGYYKLIISDQQNANNSFDDCCEIHDKSVMNSKENLSSMMGIGQIYLQVDRNCLRNRIDTLKDILSMNDIIAPDLNENFASYPSAFMNCQLFFCITMSNRIWNICEHYVRTIIYPFMNGPYSGINKMFMMSLQSAVINYLKDPKTDGNPANKSFRAIVIEALGHLKFFLENILNVSTEWELLNYFTFTNSDRDYESYLVNELLEFPNIVINGLDVQLYIPSSKIKTISQLKKTISMQTNIPTQHLHVKTHHSGEQTNDEDDYNKLVIYSVDVNEESSYNYSINCSFIHLSSAGSFENI